MDARASQTGCSLELFIFYAKVGVRQEGDGDLWLWRVQAFDSSRVFKLRESWLFV